MCYSFIFILFYCHHHASISFYFIFKQATHRSRNIAVLPFHLSLTFYIDNSLSMEIN